MAGQSATLGKLLVQLFLEDEQFHEGLKEAEVGVQRTVKRVDKLGSALKGALVTGFKAATAAAVGLVAASTAVGSSFEKQMAAVASVRGIVDLTGSEYKALEDRARELGATTAFSATEAAQGMEALARAGLSTTQILQASSTALAFAGANSLELSRSAEILAGTMAQFGIAAKDTTQIADVFTATAQNSLFSAEGLAQAMKFAGVQGAALGRDITEVSAAVAQFRNLGLEAGMAGTQYRNSMAALAKPTSQAEAAIKGLGLSLDDVNPEMHSFDVIMKRLGESGMGTQEALSIFGKRTAAAVLGVSKQLATSTHEWDLLLGKLQQAQAEGTLTAQTYETMMNNVSGQFAILRSATEEFFITMFKSFAGPLRDLLTQSAEFVNTVAKELASRSLEIRSKFVAVFGDIEKMMKANQTTAAKAFADWIVAMLDIARAMLPMIQGLVKLAALFSGLIPILDEVFIILSTIFIAQKVLAFVTAVQAAIVVAGGLQAAMYGLAASITAATGGLNLVIAALAAAVIGLRLYWNATNKAAQATRDLKAAQDQIAAQDAQRERQFTKIGDRLLTAAKNDALATKERIANGEKVQDGLEAELDLILGLDKAQAGMMLTTGELVLVNGKLRTAQGAVLFEGQAGFDAIKGKIDKAQESVAGFEEQLKQASGGGIAIAQDALDRAKQKLFNLREGFIGAATAQRKMAEASDAAARGIGAIGGAADGSEGEVDELTKKLRKFSTDAFERFQDLKFELEGLHVLDPIGEEFDKRRKQTKELYQDLLSDEKLSADQRAEIEGALQAELSTISEIEAKARAEDKLKAIESQEQRAREIIAKFQDEELTEAERVAKERDDTLLALAEATAEQRAEIERQFNEKIDRINQDAVDEAEEDSDEKIGFWEKLGISAGKAARVAQDAWSAVGSVLDKVVSGVSGFSFDLKGSVEELISLQDDAAENQANAQQDLVDAQQKLKDLMAAEVKDAQAIAEAQKEVAAAKKSLADADTAAGASPSDQAKGFVDGLINEAVRMAETFGQMAGPLLKAVADNLPILFDAIIEALPQIADALAEQLPRIMSAIGDALPDLIPALIDALMQVAVAVIQALPELLITVIVDVVPALIGAIIEALPVLLIEIIAMIPKIIAELIMALPRLVKNLWESIIKGAGRALKGIAEGIWNAIKDFFNIFKKKKDKDGKGKKGSFSGMSYVPATMRMTVHKGEAIVPADRNAESGGGGFPSPAPAGAGANGFGGGGGGSAQPLDIAILAEGRLLDAVQIRSMKRGGVVGVQKEIRRSSGVKVGIDRGRFNPWSKA